MNVLRRTGPTLADVVGAPADRPTGSTQPRSSTLSPGQEAIIAAFRRHTLRPLDDGLYARCPPSGGPPARPWHLAPAGGRGRRDGQGLPHIDIAEVQTAEGELDPFVSIDRTSKSAFVQLVGGANRVIA